MIIGAVSAVIPCLVILIAAIACTRVILWMKKKGVLSVTCTVCQKLRYKNYT